MLAPLLLTIAVVAQSPKGVDADDTQKTRDEPITIHGVVTDESGAPVSGAKVTLASQNPGYTAITHVMTNNEGRYEIIDAKLPVEIHQPNADAASGSFDVFVTKPGLALTWRDTKWYRADDGNTFVSDSADDGPDNFNFGEPVELDFIMRKPFPVTGRLVETDGTPIVGATIDVRLADRDVDPEQAGRHDFDLALSCLNERNSVPREIKTATTDADGRFVLPHMPPDSRLSIWVHADGFPVQRVTVFTQFGESVVNSSGRKIYYGSFHLDLLKPTRVKFRITHSDTGEPADRVRVHVSHAEGSGSGTTDRQGFVRIPVYVGESNIEILPRYNTPYHRTEHEFEWYPQDSADKVNEFTIAAAATVQFKVVDSNGQPVPKAYVWREPINVELRDYEMRRMVHAFYSFEAETRISHINRRMSDDNGEVTHFFKPGEYIIGVAPGISEHDTPPENAPSERVKLKPGEVRKLEFVVN